MYHKAESSEEENKDGVAEHQSEGEEKVEQNLEEAMKTKAIGTESFKTGDF